MMKHGKQCCRWEILEANLNFAPKTLKKVINFSRTIKESKGESIFSCKKEISYLDVPLNTVTWQRPQ
jgi:hypothetical protein